MRLGRSFHIVNQQGHPSANQKPPKQPAQGATRPQRRRSHPQNPSAIKKQNMRGQATHNREYAVALIFRQCVFRFADC